MVDLVGLEMGLSVYSGTSRLPLINPLMIVARDLLKQARGENPVLSFETLSEHIYGLGFFRNKKLRQLNTFCIVQKTF